LSVSTQREKKKAPVNDNKERKKGERGRKREGMRITPRSGFRESGEKAEEGIRGRRERPVYL